VAAAWDVAHERGIAELTLREVAMRVGMQPPSLYSHFESKNAIYDAMFEQAWRAYQSEAEQTAPQLPDEPRDRLIAMAGRYLEFAVADAARHHLMNVRVLPDFTPSAKAYAAALDIFERMRTEFRLIGITSDADLDLYTALLAGLASQQIANDPGGDRWLRQVPRVMEMYADAVGVPDRKRSPGRKK
jgi:AcrR family transcriptional regulator